MRGGLVNLNFIASNKQSSGLIVTCLENPHYAYSSRYLQADVYRSTFNENTKVNL